MRQCKKILLSGHTKNKEYLHRLYTDKQVYVSSLSSSKQPVAEEKRFLYQDLSFLFEGMGYRNMEKMVMYIFVPEKKLSYYQEMRSDVVAYEDFLLRMVSEPVNALSREYENDYKSKREKPQFSMQSVHSTVQRRNGCLYREQEKVFRLRVHFMVPLIHGTYINGKSAFKAIRRILETVNEQVESIEGLALERHLRLYRHQQEIRNYLQENELAAFVANGSILPRSGETDLPMEQAVPFLAPPELERELVLSDGTRVTGMGIKKGVTVITGGGYSGKSTLLDSLEMGIFNHIEGDGREYVITDQSACKIAAEDGRYIEETDLSPFFHFMSGKTSVHSFSTDWASGSVSQAAGIIEAVYGGCQLLLIDEDTSATNFMIRDQNMRLLVQNEPIIPFTDRVRELSDRGISTILVIGGSSEYLRYADEIILMEEYTAKCRTNFVKEGGLKIADYGKQSSGPFNENGHWTEEKYRKDDQRDKTKDFYYSKCVKIENARFICIDNYLSDITKLTAICSDGQSNSMAVLLEKIIAAADGETDLYEQCKNVVRTLFESTAGTILSSRHQYEFWLEEVRSVDVLLVVCRTRRNGRR